PFARAAHRGEDRSRLGAGRGAAALRPRSARFGAQRAPAQDRSARRRGPLSAKRGRSTGTAFRFVGARPDSGPRCRRGRGAAGRAREAARPRPDRERSAIGQWREDAVLLLRARAVPKHAVRVLDTVAPRGAQRRHLAGRFERLLKQLPGGYRMVTTRAADPRSIAATAINSS